MSVGRHKNGHALLLAVAHRSIIKRIIILAFLAYLLLSRDFGKIEHVLLLRLVDLVQVLQLLILVLVLGRCPVHRILVLVLTKAIISCVRTQAPLVLDHLRREYALLPVLLITSEAEVLGHGQG